MCVTTTCSRTFNSKITEKTIINNKKEANVVTEFIPDIVSDYILTFYIIYIIVKNKTT